MMKLIIISMISIATFFLACEWYWMSLYYVSPNKSGNVTSETFKLKGGSSKMQVCKCMNSAEKSRKFSKLERPWKKSHYQSAKLFGTFSKKHLLIGIPTISRHKENYLHQTLKSLLDNMNELEKSNVTILVLYVDSDADERLRRAKETALKFASDVRSGHLLLVQSQPETYPEVKMTRRTYNDSVERVRWRSKQVLDFAFLFRFSRDLSEYFLILEDDVVTTPRFVTSILQFVRDKEYFEWVSLTFSSFFIIGRLFKAEDIGKLSDFLVMFHMEKPVDLLIVQFLDLMVPNKQVVTRRIPGLFQHVGLFSSLDGKVQKAKDRSFSDGYRVFHFDNPPADLVTTLGVYKKHYPEDCYADSNRFFWGSAAKKNDTFDVILHRPVKVKRIFISSGRDSHKDDVIKYAELKVAPVYNQMLTDKKADCSEFYPAALFEKGKVDVLSSSLKSEKIQCIRIEFLKKHSNWILINEISIDTDRS